MVITTLKHDQFHALVNTLRAQAHLTPLDASFTVTMHVDEAEYMLKLQPDKNYKLAILQAVRIRRDENPTQFELITGFNQLSSLLELFVYQGVV